MAQAVTKGLDGPANEIPETLRRAIEQLFRQDSERLEPVIAKLAGLGRPGVAPMARLLRYHDPWARRGAARVLGRTGCPLAVEPLIGALGDTEFRVR